MAAETSNPQVPTEWDYEYTISNYQSSKTAFTIVNNKGTGNAGGTNQSLAQVLGILETTGNQNTGKVTKLHLGTGGNTLDLGTGKLILSQGKYLMDGKLSADDPQADDKTAITLNGASLYITGGEFDSASTLGTPTFKSGLIGNVSDGEIVVQDGITFTGKRVFLYLKGTGLTTINGGTYATQNNTYAIHIWGGGDVVINDANISANAFNGIFIGMRENSTGNLTINGGTYNLTAQFLYQVDSSSGDITINGGTFTYDVSGTINGFIVSYTTAITFAINGGTFTVGSDTVLTNGIFHSYATVRFTNGTVTVKDNAESSIASGGLCELIMTGGSISTNGNKPPIYTYNGITTLSGGTITTSGNQSIFSIVYGAINLLGGTITTGGSVEPANLNIVGLGTDDASLTLGNINMPGIITLRKTAAANGKYKIAPNTVFDEDRQYTIKMDSAAVNDKIFDGADYAVTSDIARHFSVTATGMTAGVDGGHMKFKYPLAAATPTIQQNTFTYTGGNITPTLTGYSDSTMTKSGDTQKDAGNYAITVTVKAADTVWTDSRVSQVTFPWVINKAELTKPTLTSDSTVFTYDGTEQGINISGVTSTMTLSGYTQRTNAGEYTATVTLNSPSNYKWSGVSGEDESASLSFPWVINKAEIAKPTAISPLAYTYDGGVHNILEKMQGYDNAAVIRLQGNTGTNANNYTLTASLIYPNNYKWSGVTGEGESASLSFPWVINKAELVKPTLTSDSFTYSGNETDVTRYLSGEYDAELMLLTGGRGVTSGEYGLRITLKNPDNYAWSGGGETTLILPWRINKAQPVSAEAADGLTYRVGGNLEYYDLKKMYSGGGNVKYTITEGNDIAEISSGGMLIIKGAGKIVVTATILSDDNHEGGSVVLELTVKGKLSGGDTAMIITCSSGFASTIAAAIIIVINLNRKERF